MIEPGAGHRLLLGVSLALTASGAAAQPFSMPAGKALEVSDPFSYCARVVTDDRLGVASRNQETAFLAPYIRDALGLPASVSLAPSGVFWRCLDGTVYVCAVGANLPCASKADRAKQNRGAAGFCRENPNATAVPAYATGHDTIYAWRCAAGAAVRGPAFATVDRRGFRMDIWHALRLAARAPPVA